MFKPGPLSAAEAAELEQLRRDVRYIKSLKVAAPLRIRRDPAGMCIEQIFPEENPESGGGGSSGYYPYEGPVNDSIIIPIPRYRCDGGMLQERFEWWQISAPGISATVHPTNPNEDGILESAWWCVGGTCVESTEPPDGYNAGPFATQSECFANCI